jgi:hypothetical protein
MQWTFPATGTLTADLEVPSGIVEVQLAPVAETTVELEAMGRRRDRAEELIGRTEVSCSDSRLVVSVPKAFFNNVALSLRVAIPEGSSVRVRTASADVASRGPAGDFEVSTASGDVDLSGDYDAARVTTASGDVRLGEVRGEAVLTTASGDVEAGPVGGRLSVSTASGDIRVAAVGKDARCKSASGDVEIGWASEGEIVVNTASGDVEVGVAAGVGTWLDLATVSGDSRCTISSDAGEESDATLRLSCKTLSGDILVRSAN